MTSTQRIIKYFALGLATLIICLIISSIVGALSFILMIFDPDDNSSNTSIEPITANFENIKNLDIEIGNSNLEILKGEELKIEASNQGKLKINNISNTLKLKEKSHMEFFWNNNKNSIKIYLPEEVIEKLDLDMGAGKLSMDGVNINTLKLDHGAGYVSIKNSEFAKTDIDGGAGKIEIETSILNNLDLDAGVGNTTIKNSSILGKSKISTGVGNATIELKDKKEDYTFIIDKGLGSLEIDGISSDGRFGNGSNELKIDSGVGNLSISFQKKY